jgi:hypothetical protein
MLISYRSRFLFFHNPKVAGKSIKTVLRPYCYRPDGPRWRRWLHAVGMGRPYPALPPKRLVHASAATIREHLPEAIFSDFYKFAFVRNTWDHLVSTYHFIIRDSKHRLHERVASMAGFDDYLAWRTRRPSAPQKKFVTDGADKLLVDFLGCYETLGDDFRKVCDRLGIDGRLPHVNASAHRDFRSYYTDRTAALVEAAFREDIEFFGFTFDRDSGVPGNLALRGISS